MKSLEKCWRSAVAVALLCACGPSLLAQSAVFRLFPERLGDMSSFQADGQIHLFHLRLEDHSRIAPRDADDFRLFRLGFPSFVRAAAAEPAEGHATPARDQGSGSPIKRLFDRKTLRLTGGLFLALPAVGYFAWWRGKDIGHFHVAHDDDWWFGRDDYSGGANKVSHFFFSYAACRELASVYEKLGHSPGASRALAVGVTSLAGLLVEVGDGMTIYGFSWEDSADNILGALAAAEISRRGWDDVIGFRMGFVRARIPPPENRAYGYGSDYSREIYTADLKLAGLLQRFHVRPGIGRFFLVSVTFGSKGYRFSPVDRRERNVGVDLGLNVPEILSALGVRESSWWGKPLLTFFTYYRLAYTAFGYRYDLNHRRWHGPDTGDRFDPGAVIYQ